MNRAAGGIPVRELVIAISTIGAFAITIGLAAPLTSLILEQRGESATLIGLFNAVPAIGTLLMSIWLPKILRRVNFRRFLLACLVVELCAFLALAEFDSIAAWFAIRLVMGASGAGLFIASETWINSMVVNEIRGRVTAIYGIVMGLSFALGPLIIPLLGTGRPSFWVGAGFVAIAIAIVFSNRRFSASGFDGGSRFSVVAFIAVAPVVACSIFLSSWKEVSVLGILPVYAVRSGLDSSTAALFVTAFATGTVALQYPIGWLADRFNRYALLAVSGVCTALGAILMPWYIGTGFAFFLVALWGGVSSGLYTLPMAIVGDRFKGTELATAMSCFGLLWSAGSLVGPIVSGEAMQRFGADGFPLSLGIVSVAFLLLLFVRRTLASLDSRTKMD